MTMNLHGPYKFPDETLPGLSMDEHLKDLMEVRGFLESKNIRTSNTRIERYCECLQRVVDGDYEGAPRVFSKYPTESFSEFNECMLYLMREAHELMWIIKGLKLHEPLGVEEKIKSVVSGTDFAAMDVDSTSRNAQFELRIASYFCQTGCRVDMSRVTDIVAFGDDEVFYVECKRVGGPNQLKKRISEGRRQLRERMPRKIGTRFVHGCIAADVTKVAYPHNGVTWAMSNEHSRYLIQSDLKAIAMNLQTSDVFGSVGNFIHCWLQIHIPMLIFYPKTSGTRFSSYHIFREDISRKAKRSINGFINIFQSVSREDERMSKAKKLEIKDSITIPSGALFDFDDEVVDELIRGECGKRDDPGKIVGRMKFDDVEHEFTIFEFDMAAGSFPRETIDQLEGDRMRIGILMLATMLHRRSPYVDNSA